MIIRYLPLLLLGTGQLVGSGAYGTTNCEGAKCEPFQLGVMVTSPERDRTNPLAPIDPAGWLVSGTSLIGTFDGGWVGARDVSSRKVSWWWHPGSDITAPMIALGPSLIVATRNGVISRINAATGAVEWQTELSAFTHRRVSLFGSLLFVQTSENQLYAIEFSTGKVQWTYEGGSPQGIVVRSLAAPGFYGNTVIMGTSRGELHGVDVFSGKKRWVLEPGYTSARFHDFVGELVVFQDRLLGVRYDGLVVSLSLTDGRPQVIWKQELPSASAVKFQGGALFVGDLSGQLTALNPETGAKLWSQGTGQSISSLSIVARSLVSVGTSGRINVLDPNSGQVYWHDDVGGQIINEPIVYERMILIPTGLKNLYAYRI